MPDKGKITNVEHRLDQLRRQLRSESSDSLLLLNDIKDNPICDVYFDQMIPAIVVKWKQYATSTQLRFVHECMLPMLRQHKASKILGDDTALPTVHADDRIWIAEDWMPRAIAAGLKTAASKSSATYFGKLSTENIRALAPRDLTIKFFNSLEDAREWLRNVE